MTQEEKDLLLKDLCARLPYNVMGEYSWKCGNPYKRELTGNLMPELINSFNSTGDSEFKPYLRSLSSITEEERREYDKLIAKCIYDPEAYFFENYNRLYDWLNSHHFDYRGLIEKGLALEALEGMYLAR